MAITETESVNSSSKGITHVCKNAVGPSPEYECEIMLWAAI